MGVKGSARERQALSTTVNLRGLESINKPRKHKEPPGTRKKPQEPQIGVCSCVGKVVVEEGERENLVTRTQP